VGSAPPTSARSSGQDSELITQPVQYTPVLPPPPVTGRPLQIPDVCPGCGKSLKAVGTPVFCPFCGAKLLH
jgi:hypothetical protein